jgi:hypothetical protein
MLIRRVLTIADLKSYASDDASERQHALSPVQNLAVAEGEKLRLGGPLLPEAFAPIVGASTRALLLILPTLFRAESATDYYPRSLGPFLLLLLLG